MSASYGFPHPEVIRINEKRNQENQKEKYWKASYHDQKQWQNSKKKKIHAENKMP
jgi:hypothetical protein